MARGLVLSLVILITGGLLIGAGMSVLATAWLMIGQIIILGCHLMGCV